MNRPSDLALDRSFNEVSATFVLARPAMGFWFGGPDAGSCRPLKPSPDALAEVVLSGGLGWSKPCPFASGTVPARVGFGAGLGTVLIVGTGNFVSPLIT